MTTPVDHPQHAGALPERVHVLAVGAGFGGICLATQLRRHGREDFLILDAGSSVGGTWRDNTYPGAACDVPSQLYSFSFAPNPEWTRSFSPQPEIHDYLQRVAEREGILPNMRFGVSAHEARWDDAIGAWRVDTSAGQVIADVLVNATGPLSDPRLPDIDGIDDFAGDLFHTARWDHDTDLTGKRVAVIGTGASAIQVIPEIAKETAHLDVYQRTAAWVIPRNDRRYPWLERQALRHVPGLQRLYRSAIYWAREGYVPGFVWRPQLAKPAELLARANIRRGISDPALREKVTPDFRIGCKRILISNTYYPTLDRPDVDLVTDPIARVTPTGIVTANGVERPVDAIVVATGFNATDQPLAHHVTGRTGRTLADTWAEHGMAAYKGTTVRGFPNVFHVVGPNTGLGHSSMVLIIESQVAYIVDALQTMDDQGIIALEPREDAQQEWNTDLQHRLARTVWNTGGCGSWYLDEHGRNTTLWPRTTYKFRELLEEFDIDRYDLTYSNPIPDRTQTRTEVPA